MTAAPWKTAPWNAAPWNAALYECRIAHARAEPVRNSFTYHSYQWLVDLDDLPVLPWWLRPLAGFRAADHLGGPGGSIRANVDRYLATQGIEASGQILMLAHARVLGYVFNPLSVFWCHHTDGTLACVLVEVHNTYGGRHCYLLRTDERGRAEIGKGFYVSPFYPVEGQYRMSVPEPGERLALTVVLNRPGARPFTASVRGKRSQASALTLLGAVARHPWSTLAVSARIRWQGLKLYSRGLRPFPRPRCQAQEGQR